MQLWLAPVEAQKYYFELHNLSYHSLLCVEKPDRMMNLDSSEFAKEIERSRRWMYDGVDA